MVEEVFVFEVGTAGDMVVSVVGAGTCIRARVLAVAVAVAVDVDLSLIQI